MTGLCYFLTDCVTDNKKSGGNDFPHFFYSEMCLSICKHGIVGHSGVDLGADSCDSVGISG